MDRDTDGKELDRLFREINTNLGGTGVEVELEDEDFILALDEAMRTYYSLSANSSERGFIFLEMTAGQQDYYLPVDIEEVMDIRRSKSGLAIGRNYEPFTAAFIQSVFSNSGSQLGINSATNLVGYEAVAQYQEQVGRMFGEFVPHIYNAATRMLRVFNYPRSEEVLALDVSRRKSREELLSDTMTYRWIRKYAEAHARGILGEKYSKVSVLPSAQGGMTLKDLKTGAEQMKQTLEKELTDFVDGGEPVMPFMG